MKKNKTVIIHFQPLEYYPPVQNAIDDFASDMHLTVFSLNYENIKNKFVNKKAKIIRPIRINTNDSKIIRLFKYIYFNAITVIKTLLISPKNIIYYETESAFPAYFLKKYLGLKSSIYIHYHEYNTPEQYMNGMTYTRYLHKRETYLYHKACWISHTNQYRINMFLSDLPMINPDKLIQLANYPPISWKKEKSAKQLETPVKMVYVGSLSTQNMYTQKLFDWIISMKGKFILDIYSINIRPDVIELMNKVQTNYINFKGGLNYQDIPEQLKKYDIGLILYKDFSPNYIYNETNKLFEYMACGLDVWYSSTIIAIDSYKTDTQLPKVISIDFENINKTNYKKHIQHNGLIHTEYELYAENALQPLKNRLLN